MVFYCIGSYLVVALFISVFIWSALILAKRDERDDRSRGFDLIEDAAMQVSENT